MTTTVQQTGKLWKLQMLLAALLTVVGTIMAAYEFTKDEPGDLAAIGLIALFVGLCWFIGARIGAWWFHG
jgi:hypothetical protein